MPSASTTKKKRDLSLSRRETIWAYALISPWIIGFLLFTAGPMLASAYISLTDYKGAELETMRYVGLNNWNHMLFSDARFIQSLKVTLTYAVVSLPLGLALGLGLALLLNAKVPGLSIWRTIYYLPSVVTGVAVAILWLYVFNPRFGLLNWVLSWVGIRGPDWLRSPDWALPALIIMGLWGVGGSMIVYLAGLQGIPTAYYEAAKIDGANGWQQFWKITLPLITPVLFYNLVTGIIGTFQLFTSAFIMTSPPGGPDDATLFYNLYLYMSTFTFNDFGYGAAMAWFLLFVVLILTLLVFRSSPMWVYYEGELRR